MKSEAEGECEVREDVLIVCNVKAECADVWRCAKARVEIDIIETNKVKQK